MAGLLSLLGMQPDQAPMGASSMSATSMAKDQSMQQPQQPGGLLGLGGNFGGLLDFQDPKTLIALQFIANGQRAPGEMLDGIPQIAAYGNKLQQQKQAQEKELTTKNQTVAWLEKNSPELAAAVKSGGLSASDAYSEFFKQKDPLRQLQIQTAQQGLRGNWQKIDENRVLNPVTGEIKDLPANPLAPMGGLGLSPQYGVDENGNPVLIQVSKTGKAVRTELPEGVTLSKEPIKLDTGTSYTFLDPITRQTVGTVPKNLQQAEQDKELGTQQGKLRAQLPVVENNASTMLGTIDSVLNDPYLPNMLGTVSSKLPNWTADAQRVQSRMDQLTGQSFLQAYNQLRGSGAITEVEGLKGEKAIARLNAAQNEKDYREALMELRDVIQRGVETSRRAAGVQGGAPVQAPKQDDPFGIR